MTDHNDDFNDKNIGKAYEVGYGRPPKHTRYRKGVSGNPTGGRKRAVGINPEAWEDPFQAFLLEPIVATVNGKKTKVSRYELHLKTLVREALEGDADSSMMLLKESDHLRVLINPDLRPPSSADLAYIEEIRRSAARFAEMSKGKKDDWLD